MRDDRVALLPSWISLPCLHIPHMQSPAGFHVGKPFSEADSLVDKGKCCRPSFICLWCEVCSSKVDHVLLPDKGIEQLQCCCKSISSKFQSVSQAEVVVGARIPDGREEVKLKEVMILLWDAKQVEQGWSKLVDCGWVQE